uniref:Uncharacterized protein n=1 Tax=Anguilla anguilla TaxID=7936 RepID=A0A0E9XZB1_ANGAN
MSSFKSTINYLIRVISVNQSIFIYIVVLKCD